MRGGERREEREGGERREEGKRRKGEGEKGKEIAEGKGERGIEATYEALEGKQRPLLHYKGSLTRN